AQRDVRAARPGDHDGHDGRFSEFRQVLPQCVLALEAAHVRSRTLRRGPLEVDPLRPSGHRARVLRHSLAHERVHRRVQPSVLRAHRRRGTLPHRERAARRLRRRRVERRHAVGYEAGERPGRRHLGAGLHDPMKLLSSLRSRMFLASAVLAVLCIATAIYIVNGQVTREAERTLEREIIATSAQVDQLRAESAQTFTLMARLIADLPKLKAAIATDDPPTVQNIASEYQSQLKASMVLVTNKSGRVLYAAGGSPRAADIAAHQPAVRDALAGRDSVSLLPQPGGILQIVTVPVALEQPRHEILGTMSAGILLDDALAAQLKKMTGSDVAFGMDGQILASTLPRDQSPALAERLRTTGISRIVLGSE